MDATVAECKAAEQAARADANRRGLRYPLRLHIKGWWNKQGTQHDYCLNNWVGASRPSNLVLLWLRARELDLLQEVVAVARPEATLRWKTRRT